MSERPSSLDKGYVAGNLSLFPDVLDDKDSLYEARNNAESVLRTGLPYNGKKMIVEDTSLFPPKGIVRVGPPPGRPGDAELIYYGLKTDGAFKELVRGFAGSRQNQWPSGAWVTNAVTAEPHNAVKDAIINIEKRIGLEVNPDLGSLNRRLKDMELKFLSPKSAFRSFPRRVRPGQPIRFQNLSEGDVIRNLWDFGDGGQSMERSPTYTYMKEGKYTVRLHIVTSSGAQGISTKNNYVTVSEQETPSFFYFKKLSPLKYSFVDQTDGDILQRFWVFGGAGSTVVNGTRTEISGQYMERDSSKHEVTYQYDQEGVYEPSLLLVFAGDQVKRIFLNEKLEAS
jgi:PKD repeat protein